MMVSHAHPGDVPASPPPTSDSSPGGWTPRLIFSLGSIVLVLELLAMSYLMISMAMPDIIGHYHTAQGAWLLTSFLLVGAVTAPLIGKLADMYGKRKLLLACIGLAAVGSLISALAPSYAVLIAGRSLSGLLIPCLFLSYSLIRDVFPAKIIALSVSIATSGMGLIAVPAPFVTGWLIDHLGFRSIFWFFLIGLVILGVMIRVSTDETSVRLRSRVDIGGAILLGAGLAGVLIGVSFGPTWGWRAGSTLLYLIGGVALIVIWLVTSTTKRDPLIDLAVLRRRSVILTAITAGFTYGISGLYVMLLPMLAMTPAILGLGYGFGLDAEGFAILQAPIGFMTVIGGIIVGVLVGRKFSPKPLMAAAMVTLAIGCVLTAFSHDSKGALIVFAGIVGLGQGLGYAAVPNLVIASVPPQLQASTASIMGVFQSMFPAILPVIVFTVLNNSYVAALPPEMTQGAVLYTDKGFTIAFLFAAGAAVVGLVAAVLLPRRIERVAPIDDDDLGLVPAT